MNALPEFFLGRPQRTPELLRLIKQHECTRLLFCAQSRMPVVSRVKAYAFSPSGTVRYLSMVLYGTALGLAESACANVFSRRPHTYSTILPTADTASTGRYRILPILPLAVSILLLLPHSADFRVVRCGAAVADNKGRRAGLVHRTGAASHTVDKVPFGACELCAVL